MKSNWLDGTIGFFSPESAARRMRARLLMQQLHQIHSHLERKYEGASSGRRTEGWVTSGSSANSEISGSLSTLRNRSRDLVRNNGFGSRAVRAITSNVIGIGIIPRIIAENQRAKDTALSVWKEWAETMACDADGMHDLYGLQALAMRTIIESGEVIIRKRRRREEDGLPIPVQLQILEPDYIDASKTYAIDTGKIVQGVEFDKLGRRVAYWLFSEHPGEVGMIRGGFASARVPASEILHIYRDDRPGQVHGVPWGAPVIVRLRDFNEFEDAQLIRQKIAACFTAFIHDAEAGNEFTTTEKELAEKVEPGMIEILPPNKDVTFGQPPSVEGYRDYSTVSLRGIAAGFDIPYEVLTGDLSQVNFSSARMGWLQFQRDIDVWRWHMVIPRLCAPLFEWFKEAATLSGIPRIESIMTSWTAPRREMIDPTREVPAIRDAIRSGQITLSEAIREAGYDPAEQFAEMKSDADLLDRLGLILDCDPRRVSISGQLQAAPAGGA